MEIRRERSDSGGRPAISLHASAGFGPIPRYGPFVDDPTSVCSEKRLR